MRKWILSIKAMMIALAIVLTPSCGKDQSKLPDISGVKGPIFTVVNGSVLVSFKFLNMQVYNGFKAKIPKTDNSSVEFSPNATESGMLFVITVDPADLKKIEIGAGDGNYLPDGRAIPGIPGGKLENSLRVDTQLEGLSFFYHPKLFGVWMPVGFDTAGFGGSWPLKMNGTQVGMLGLVASDAQNGLTAGGLIFLNLEVLKNREFIRLIQMSKRYPNRVF